MRSQHYDPRWPPPDAGCHVQATSNPNQQFSKWAPLPPIQCPSEDAEIWVPLCTQPVICAEVVPGVQQQVAVAVQDYAQKRALIDRLADSEQTQRVLFGEAERIQADVWRQAHMNGLAFSEISRDEKQLQRALENLCAVVMRQQEQITALDRQLQADREATAMTRKMDRESQSVNVREVQQRFASQESMISGLSQELKRLLHRMEERDVAGVRELGKIQMQVDRIVAQLNALDHRFSDQLRVTAQKLESEHVGLEHKLEMVASHGEQKLKEEEDARRTKQRELLGLIDQEQNCMKLMEGATVSKMDSRFSQVDKRLGAITDDYDHKTAKLLAIITHLRNQMETTSDMWKREIEILRKGTDGVKEELQREIRRMSRPMIVM